VPVVIKLEDGRKVVVQHSLDEVKRAFQVASRSGDAIEIDTPSGRVFINPHQVLSFAEAPQPSAEELASDPVAEPA